MEINLLKNKLIRTEYYRRMRDARRKTRKLLAQSEERLRASQLAAGDRMRQLSDFPSQCDVRLKGISKKGKQRIKQYGEVWRVTNIGDPQVKGGAPCYLVRPLMNPCGDIRWICINDDPDFEIVEKKGHIILDLDRLDMP